MLPLRNVATVDLARAHSGSNGSLAILQMQELVAGGHQIVTWNGLGFDFPILAEESGRIHEEVKELALNHVDMMFQLYCDKGYPVSLRAATKGSGTAEKMEHMDGKKSLVMWADGQREEVLRYCEQDAVATVDLARKTAERKWLQWISRSNRVQTLDLPRGWLTVRRTLELPLPDTSWMTDPIPREQFTGWLDLGHTSDNVGPPFDG